MTDLAQSAGAAALGWLGRHLASILSVVFASGFAWAQFGALADALDETRGRLEAIHASFVEFRVDQSGLVRREVAAEITALATRQRETDLRQDREIEAARSALLRLLERTAGGGDGRDDR